MAEKVPKPQVLDSKPSDREFMLQYRTRQSRWREEYLIIDRQGFIVLSGFSRQFLQSLKNEYGDAHYRQIEEGRWIYWVEQNEDAGEQNEGEDGRK